MKLDAKTAAQVAKAQTTLPDALWAGSIGWACLSARLCLCRNGEPCGHPAGSDQWDEQYFRWPQQRSELLAAAGRLSAQTNVYFAPSLLRADSRTGQNAQPGRWLWTELDEGCRSDIADWARQNRAVLVASGTPGHHHLYLPLDRLYPPEQVGTMNRALGKLLGASTPGGQHAASVMRLPGTWNLKRKPRRKVRLLVPPDGFRGHGEDSLARLGLLVPDSAPELPGGQPVNVEDLPEPRRPARMDRRLRGFLEEQPAVGTRSGRTHALVAYAMEQGKTDAEVVWLVAHFPPALDRGDERYQAARLVSKLRPLHSHAGRACGTVGCPNAPDWHSQRPAATHTEPEPVEPETQEEPVTEQPADQEEPESAAAHLFLPDEFWEARKCLRHIRQAARSRRAAPDAVLLDAMSRVSALTHPRWRGPDDATLDLLGVVVATSGRGKGTASRTARALVPGLEDREGPTYTRDLGSGEGMTQCYFGMVEDPDNPKRKAQTQVRWGLLFQSDEGTTYLKLAERSGQTTGETLRKMVMGEMLGGTYASNHNREVWLAPYSYRAAVVMSVQPEAFGGFLADWRTGTPQRALWASGIDPDAPDDRPAWPGPLRWKPDKDDLRADPAASYDCMRLAADEQIVSEIDAGRAAALRGGPVGQYDSHRNLLRLKVAMLLAVLDGRLRAPLAVTLEDWQLAGLVLDNSDAVRTRVVGAVASDQEQQESSRNAGAARRAAAVRSAELAAEYDVERVARVLVRACCRHPEGLTTRELDKTTASRDRHLAELARKHAEASGLLSQDEEDRWHAQ